MVSPAVQKIFEDAVMLFVVIDPFGTLPLFLSVTGKLSPPERRRVALRGCIYAYLILLAFIIGGQILLDALHIRLGSFEIAGGLILFLMGVKMVFAHGHGGEGSHEDPGHDIAIFPVALPWLAGPSAIVAAVLLTDNDRFSVAQQTMTALVLAGILLVTYLCLLLAGPIQKMIGQSGVNIVSRIMGIILAALSVELMLTGLSTVFKIPL